MSEDERERLVLVEWSDSHSFSDGKWVDRSDVTQKGVSMGCRSVGWIVSEDEDAITIVAHETETQYGGDMMIPRCAIKEIRCLMPKPEDQQDEFV